MLADIPRRIWFHWRQGEDAMPPVVRACLTAWRAKNPDWDVVFVDGQSVWDHLDRGSLPVDALLGTSEQVYANAVRVRLLSTHGGVWVDATTRCRRPLSAWLMGFPGEFFAFDSPGPDWMMANWFLASATGGYVVGRLADEYIAMFERLGPLRVQPHATTAEIRAGVKDTDVFLDPALLSGRGYPYFLFHYLFASLYRRDGRFRDAWNAAARISADGCHAAQGLGLARPADAPALGVLREADPPLHKLSWRFDDIKTGTLLHAVVSGLV